MGPGKLLIFGVREISKNRPQIVKFFGVESDRRGHVASENRKFLLTVRYLVAGESRSFN